MGQIGARVRGAEVLVTSMRRTRSFVAIAALAVAACGGGTKSSSAPAAAPPSATKNAINPMSRDKLKDGGTLTWPLDDMPPNFNMSELDGSDFGNQQVMAAVMPTTYDIAADASPLWDHDLLASEPKLTTDPTQIITYEINPKAAWSDGTPITWQDFYWQWKASNGTDKRYQIVSANGYDQIANVARGKDDREVVVTMRRKYADWQALFTGLYPASTNKDPELFNNGWKGKVLVTAGPFKLDSVDQTAKTITLVRNEKWWGNPAKLDRIVFRVIGVDAQTDALANGELDAIDVGSDANKFNRVKGVSGTEVRIAGGPNFTHIDFEGASPVLQDVRVRRALAMGIDRMAITRALLGPLGLQAAVLNNHIFMENQQGYRDNSDDVGKYDPEKAKQLLDQAGWKLQGSVRMMNGMPLDVRMVIPGGITTSRQVAELVQNMLAQVGAKVSIDTVPVDDFFPKYVTPGQFDLTLFSWMGTPFPMSASQSLYKKPAKDDKGQLVIQQNYPRIGSDEIDQLFVQAAQELDRQKAIDIANHIDALIWQEAHSLTLYQRPEIWVCRKGLANFGAFGFASIVYQDIGWAK